MWTQPFSVVPSNSLIQPSRRRPDARRVGECRAALRQREGDDRVARLRRVLAAAAGGDHDVLPAVDHVDARRGIAAGGQLMLPQHAARVLFERANLLVRRRGDEDHAARGRDRAAEVERAGIADALRDQLGILAERHLPENVPLDEVDGVQRAPGRRDRRHAVRIEEQRDSRRSCTGSAAARRRRRALTSPGGVSRIRRRARSSRAAGTGGTPACALRPCTIDGLDLLRRPLQVERAPACAAACPGAPRRGRPRRSARRSAGPVATGVCRRRRARRARPEPVDRRRLVRR